ncbi:MAG: tetratricopeptide repeat protein [Bacteroidota bacterium]
MKRQQIILASAGIVLLIALYFFGQTVPPAKNNRGVSGDQTVKAIDAQDILQASKSKLTPSQLSYVNRVENSVVRGDVKNQQLNAYRQLAGFWKDSVKEGFLPFAYYTGEAAKLENSEKSLTFAAQLFLENLREQDNPGLKSWMATEAKGLFEKALELNPNNDSLKVGLGACYIFGSQARDAQEVMQGIQRILEVSRRDSANMYAQFMLGLGGVISGQLDKAAERLKRVAEHEPWNIEAVLTLAQIYEQKGNKDEAIKWYEAGKKLIRNPEVMEEIDKHIKSLQ